MSELWQKSRCDDGSMMIHTEGDVMAFVDTNKGSPEDEATADRIITAVNAYDKQRSLIETLVKALEECAQRNVYDGDYFHDIGLSDRMRASWNANKQAQIALTLAAAKSEGFDQ